MTSNDIQVKQLYDAIWLSLAGIAGVIIGLLTFLMAEVTAVLLLYYVIAWLVVTGLMQMIAGIRLPKEIKGEFFLIVGSLLTVLFGLYLLMFRHWQSSKETTN